jgi:hypothetical protein
MMQGSIQPARFASAERASGIGLASAWIQKTQRFRLPREVLSRDVHAA